MIRKKVGQTTFEYTILIIIVLAVLLTVGNYVKRGMQGRWKTAVDDLGDQYDPRVANSSVKHALVSNQETIIRVIDSSGGYWTRRTDDINSVETKTGTISVGAY